jgi:DNA-binding NarL/FixJ family response regulator
MTAAATPAPRPTAVICDDDSMSRSLWRGVLDRVGFDVLASTDNAIEALNVVMMYRPDVLLLDLVLPGTSGETIIPTIREAVPSCAVVVCSAFDATPAIHQGAVYVVPKGSVDQLANMLTALAKRAPSGAA